MLAGANSTSHGLVYNGTAISNSTNSTNIPTGIYGPSGVDSSATVALQSSTAAPVMTTAIQAGQTAASTTSVAKAASGRVEMNAAVAVGVAVLTGLGWCLM